MPFPFPIYVDSQAGALPPHPRLPNTGFSGLGLPAWSPVASPSHDHGRARLHQRQSYYYDSVNALLFGFLATAILVSMFLVMAVFERFLRPAEHPQVDSRGDIEGGKPSCFHSSKGLREISTVIREARIDCFCWDPNAMKVYDNGVSVLMPGDEVPSFIAHHAPLSLPPERHPQPTHQQTSPREHPT